MRMFKVARVHRHGLSPTDSHQKKHQRTEKIHVREWIESEPPLPMSRGVAQTICHPRVTEFVDSQNKDESCKIVKCKKHALSLTGKICLPNFNFSLKIRELCLKSVNLQVRVHSVETRSLTRIVRRNVVLCSIW